MKPILTVKRVPCSFVRALTRLNILRSHARALVAVVKLDEDVPPVAHQNGRDDVVLNVVQIVFQIGGRQGPRRRRSEHGRNPRWQNTCR